MNIIKIEKENVANDSFNDCRYTDEINMAAEVGISEERRATRYLIGNYKTAFNWSWR